jgi:hypothetical protein
MAWIGLVWLSIGNSQWGMKIFEERIFTPAFVSDVPL